MEFRSLKPKDYSDKIIDTINLLPLTNKKRELNNDDKNSILKFCNIFGKEKLRYGHMELHLDNIIIANKDKEVYFVDFEKFHPHVIQLDIISLLTNPDIINYYKEHYKESINRYINYYMDINKIVDKKDFLYILDIANIIYNLKMINMIDRNNK
jgi:hypothetical protein